jgi:hypothetical protein
MLAVGVQLPEAVIAEDASAGTAIAVAAHNADAATLALMTESPLSPR